MNRIPLYKLDCRFESRVISSGQWIDGPLTRRLEEELREYLGVEYVILTNSGSSSLLAGYFALRERFSTIHVDPYTFPATYQPAKLLGYETTFHRWIGENAEPPAEEGLHVLVHLFGMPTPLLEQVQERRLPFIEDACQSFGAEFEGKKVGTLGMLGFYSFYPTKSLHTCGHGGAIVTNSEELYETMKPFVEAGRRNGAMTEGPALNLRIDEVKCEFLLAELAEYEGRIALQREIAFRFLERIPKPQPFLEERPGIRHIYSVCNLVVNNQKEFRSFMDARGIDTMIYYDAPMLPVSERIRYADITSSIAAIPCRWNLRNEEVERIERALTEYFDR